MQLAHNVWDKDKGRSQVQVIHTFGRTDQVDMDGVRRLAGSLLRYLDRSTGAAGLRDGPGESDRDLRLRPVETA